MKIYEPIFLFIILLMFFSCGKNTVTTPITYDYQAISLGVGGDCHLCQIKFLDNVNKVDSILGIKVPSDSIYYTLNLPDALNSAGTIIQMNFRKPLYVELPVCNYLSQPVTNVVMVTEAAKK